MVAFVAVFMVGAFLLGTLMVTTGLPILVWRRKTARQIVDRMFTAVMDAKQKEFKGIQADLDTRRVN